MALQKQEVPINFIQGLDTKNDPFQVAPGKFLALTNSVFDTGGRLTKRNGFRLATTLPDQLQTQLTTYNNNLIATGSNLYAYNADIKQWANKGDIQPVHLSVSSIVRSSTAQTSPDMALAPNGLICTTYMDSGLAYYQISDSTTGQQVIPRKLLAAASANPRTYVLGIYFIVLFEATVSSSTHLQYIAIPYNNPTIPTTPADIATNVDSLTAGYDAGLGSNNTLYIAYSTNASDVDLNILNSSLQVGTASSTAVGESGDLVSVTVDNSGNTPVVYVTSWDMSSGNGYISSYSNHQIPILAPTQIITTTQLHELTTLFVNGSVSIFYEVFNTFNNGVNTIQSDFIDTLTVSPTGTPSSTVTILRSVGLASKPFVDSSTGKIYVIATYGEENQPTYFLIDSTGAIYMRLAYSNGIGFKTSQVLPSVSMLNDEHIVPYEVKDFLATVNKGTNLPAGTPVNGIYTQTGINIAKFTINNQNQYSTEIASALHLTGGQLWEYDGVKPVEHGFHVWPEDVGGVANGTGGTIEAGTYYYQFTYEWTDNQGNIHRSAPSIPVSVTTTGTTSSISLVVPTLRLTYKIDPNPVRIVGYRWSVAQQVYYQFTSITSPIINDTTTDTVTIVDTAPDAAILGQTILYTTGGVIEDIAAPASVASCLFANRLFLVDAEDRNLIWFSKQVIENVPVEMSDLLTYYVAPTTGAQGSTGDITALSAMDDKLIIFKQDAIYYMNGSGPDNTGANSSFSPDAIFITSSVGCSNPDSIVLMPSGIMFQSDKGIWLLGRDLSTNYIGQQVEKYNDLTVRSAQAIPGTNQVRFIIDQSTTLMYDYFYQQWGTFTNLNAISATLYNAQHTYLNAFGQVLQETPGTYLDNSSPVLMSFTTSWMNIAGLQGYERFYFAYLLGTYITPFKLNVDMAYDYNPSATQRVLVSPDNYAPAWGGEANWGSSQDWGGPGNIFQARVFPSKQKCESMQITITELYDSSLGVNAGAGLTLSGLNMTIGVKRGHRTQSAKRSFG